MQDEREIFIGFVVWADQRPKDGFQSMSLGTGQCSHKVSQSHGMSTASTSTLLPHLAWA